MAAGKLFVISGASGVGKSTVLAKVMEARQDLCFSVSATTRAPRPKEIEAVDYYFVSKKQFEDMIAQDAFVEYSAHMDNYYGTPKQQLLDIEPNGAFSVRRQRPDAVLIFIAPPSMEELERRLRSRGDTAEEQIRIRLERAQWEIQQSKMYDYVVINDNVDNCANEILKIIANSAI